MLKAVSLAFLFVLGCASNDTTKHDYAITGDQCKVYDDQTSCDAHSPCHWYDLGIPCQVGQPCVSGVCSAPSTGGGGTGGGGGGGGGTGSGSAACVCFDGGVCYEQIGGPAQQSGTTPQIQCYPASACPGGCSSVCDEIVGQGTCSEDPNVSGLCICDNGIR